MTRKSPSAWQAPIKLGFALLLTALSCPILSAHGEVQNSAASATHETKTPPRGSIERRALLDALRGELRHWSGLEVVFVVTHLKMHRGWAWIEAMPQSPDARNRYEPVSSLLQREGSVWQVVEMRPCCGECADDEECADDKRYFRKLREKFPAAPSSIFPE